MSILILAYSCNNAATQEAIRQQALADSLAKAKADSITNQKQNRYGY